MWLIETAGFIYKPWVDLGLLPVSPNVQVIAEMQDASPTLDTHCKPLLTSHPIAPIGQSKSKR